MQNAIVLTFLVLVGSQAFAANKCVGPDGKVHYQDTVCATGEGTKVQTNQNTFERTEVDRRNTPSALQQQAATVEASRAAQEKAAARAQKKAAREEESRQHTERSRQNAEDIQRLGEQSSSTIRKALNTPPTVVRVPGK